MLLPFLIQADDPVTGMDVVGMAPVIEIVRHDAALRGWTISCEGYAGEEQVIRLSFPRSESQAQIQAYFAPGRIGSQNAPYTVRYPPTGSGCSGPGTVETGEEGPVVTVLRYGSRAMLARLVSLAHACGFNRAILRPLLPAEVSAGTSASDLEDWRALDTQEDIARRYGPGVCMIQMERLTAAPEPRDDQSERQ